jgi:L-iditol 2-dehydrogenase
MLALILQGDRDLQLLRVSEPQVGPNDVLIRVKACGICGSDVHGYDGSTGRRIPPLIMGHEAAGVIAAKGENVRGFTVGDRVTFDSTVSCGTCRFCRNRQVNLCEKREVLGVSCRDYRRDGAFAEYVSIPQNIVYKLPEALGLEQAALIEAVSIAVHAAKITDIQPGSSAVVIGAGMIGILAVQAFRAYGCNKVIAVDLEQSKLDMAREMGASESFLASDPDLIGKITSSTGTGPDIAVEAVGAERPLLTAINCVRRGGTVTRIGNLAPVVKIPLQTVVTKQIRLQGSCASAGEYQECIDLMELGVIRVDPLISAVAPLSDGPEWFSRLYNREPGLLKVVLRP